MHVRWRMDHPTAEAGEKIVVAVEGIDLHDMAGLGLDEEHFKIHALLGSFPKRGCVKALFSVLRLRQRPSPSRIALLAWTGSGPVMAVPPSGCWAVRLFHIEG